MKKSMKAALLSAFLFPGIGHYFLKKYIAGTVLVGTAFAALYLIISSAVSRALEITEKIQRGDVQLDVTAITELVSKQPTGTEAHLLDIATAVLIITWLIGIFDSFRVGRLQDNDAKSVS
jgi:hypothetical protein